MKKIKARGGPIDSKILDLVAGLNCWGIKTDMSKKLFFAPIVFQGNKKVNGFPGLGLSFVWMDLFRFKNSKFFYIKLIEPERIDKYVNWV